MHQFSLGHILGLQRMPVATVSTLSKYHWWESHVLWLGYNWSHFSSNLATSSCPWFRGRERWCILLALWVTTSFVPFTGFSLIVASSNLVCIKCGGGLFCFSPLSELSLSEIFLSCYRRLEAFPGGVFIAVYTGPQCLCYPSAEVWARTLDN